MRLLVATSDVPWPLCYGGRLHAFELCKRLARRHTLRVISERGGPGPETGFPFECIAAGQPDGGLCPANAPHPTAGGRVERFFGIDPAFGAELTAEVERWRPDVVVGMGYRLLAPLAGLREVPTVCDLGDDEALHRLLELWRGRLSDKWTDLKTLVATLLYQRRCIRRVSAVTVLSEADQRFCRWHTGHPRIECIPHGVDCDHYAPGASPEEPERIIFWGGLTFGPNVSAILHFAERVWPAVIRRRPGLRWSIVGWGWSPPLDRLRGVPGIEFVGRVDDIRPHVRSAAVAVVPMVSGAGIKNKILEAWAMARPVLCTPRALGTLPGVHGENVWLAQSPRKLAEGLLALLDDPSLRRRLGDAARRTAVNRCSWERAAGRLERLCTMLALRGAGASRPPRGCRPPIKREEALAHAAS